MKINTELGFRPVPFSELTDDHEFWEGCKGCRNFDILERNHFKMCLCTGLLYDPAEKNKNQKPKTGKPSVGKVVTYLPKKLGLMKY